MLLVNYIYFVIYYNFHILKLFVYVYNIKINDNFLKKIRKFSNFKLIILIIFNKYSKISYETTLMDNFLTLAQELANKRWWYVGNTEDTSAGVWFHLFWKVKLKVRFCKIYWNLEYLVNKKSNFHNKLRLK